ncbi:nitrogen fixation protein NifW [Alginatibacterium sediminis]|uniref:Nitrogen fixation protein NifW n=1 Tax=Alginatibacterium sediminis TaxID=2164068 RepID=A0A420E6U6_9ALTE|nr:nitrogenase-stabilizing/protective protein NifW [Alginatibacterium sediminis]RKF13648.1 nitrogen fixation protein NifW [Alginatibacterium sediminis]
MTHVSHGSLAKHKPSTLEHIAQLENMTEVLAYLEIDADRSFVEAHQQQLMRRFNGYLILSKADDWFSCRRALKNAYCRIQRTNTNLQTGRQACRGCTSCERR